MNAGFQETYDYYAFVNRHNDCWLLIHVYVYTEPLTFLFCSEYNMYCFTGRLYRSIVRYIANSNFSHNCFQSDSIRLKISNLNCQGISPNNL